MKRVLISIIDKCVPYKFKEYIFNRFIQEKHLSMSFSQEGEDLVLNRFFADKTNGCFVDVGAHHPFRFSNTYLFYTKGWRGINIDPLPGAMDSFKNHREEDVNLPYGVSSNEGELVYYSFNEPALNTFSKEKADEYLNHKTYKLKEQITCKVLPLKQILDTHLKENKHIDFLTIDCEGLDLEVLQSNDWQKYRPTIVLAESHTSSLSNIESCPIYNFMKTVGYTLHSKTHYTYFYQDSTC